MYYMMEHLSRTSEIFDDDVRAEYRDYYQDFTLKYGITPTEYIVFLFWELHYYNSSKNALSKSKCWRNVDIIYKDIKEKRKISKVIDILKTEPFKLKELPIEYNIDKELLKLLSEANEKYGEYKSYLKNIEFDSQFFLILLF